MKIKQKIEIKPEICHDLQTSNRTFCVITKTNVACVVHNSRIVFSRKNGHLTFYSSGGDVIPSFPQIEKALLVQSDELIRICNEFGEEQITLDGEYYNHDIPFEEVSSACGTRVHITEEKELLRAKIKFYLFDICLPIKYSERRALISNLYDSNYIVQPLFYKGIASEEFIDKCFEEFLSNGYEGAMIRRLHMPYEHKRSKQLLKYKPLLDDEFKVIGFKKSITGDTLGSLICLMEDGREFDANPIEAIGSDKTKKEIWDNKEKYLGSFVTVQFLNYTQPKDSKYAFGLPRHPRAKCFRKGKSID